MTDLEPPHIISRKDLEAKIIAKAWTDEAFRRKFLADPKAQFEEHLGTRLPETLQISAYQEDADSLHFVIPERPKGDLDELSDEDLEKVAGGLGVVGVTVLLGTIVVSITASVVGSAAASGVASAITTIAVGAATGWGRPPG